MYQFSLKIKASRFHTGVSDLFKMSKCAYSNSSTFPGFLRNFSQIYPGRRIRWQLRENICALRGTHNVLCFSLEVNDEANTRDLKLCVAGKVELHKQKKLIDCMTCVMYTGCANSLHTYMIGRARTHLYAKICVY